MVHSVYHVHSDKVLCVGVEKLSESESQRRILQQELEACFQDIGSL